MYKFEQEHSCARLKTLTEKYGQGWLSLEFPRLYRGQNCFIENKYLPLIENYSALKSSSKREKFILNKIKEVCHADVISNTRNIISPYELDIYIPKLKLAIEYNGIYWHRFQKEEDKFYHLNKSLACRDKNIRLIHIYEFEDFNQQLNLLKQLILRNDLYPKEDFNKNNLIDKIPKPCLIYDKQYIIYGAGPLYETT